MSAMAGSASVGQASGTGGYGDMFSGLREGVAAAVVTVQKHAEEAASAVHERIETAKAGNKLLEVGGLPLEAKLLAKKTSCDAVALDMSIVAKLQDTATMYADATAKFRTAQSLAGSEAQRAQSVSASAGLCEEELDWLRVSGADGDLCDYLKLADAYDSRARAITEIIQVLGSPPQMPAISDPEGDAITILVAKGHYRWAVTKTEEGLSSLKEAPQSPSGSISNAGASEATSR